MKNTLAWQLFAALDKKEVAAFGRFLRSPCHNRRTDVLALFDIFRNFSKKETESQDEGSPEPFGQIAPAAKKRHSKNEDEKEALSKNNVWQKLFPGEKFDNLALNRTANHFAERLEAFLATEELAQNAALEGLLRARAFRRRGLHEHFGRNARQLLDAHRRSPHRNGAYWLAEYQILNEIAAHELAQRRAAPVALPEASAALSNFFMLETLRWACAGQSLRALSRTASPAEVPFAEAVVARVGGLGDEAEPGLALLRENLLALRDPDDDAVFERLKSLLARHAARFPPAEARDLYMSAINFCIRRHNRGDRRFTREALDLYREALAAGVLLDNGSLPAYTYNNMHTLARTLGELDWARDFLEKNKALLPADARQNTYRFNLAAWHFRAGNHAEVLRLLGQVEFSEVFMQAESRKMMLQSYYELAEWQALSSALDSFAAWLRRQKALGYHRDNYLNLVRFVKKMARTGGSFTRRQLAVLSAAVRAEQYLAEREWVLGKLR